MHGSFASFRAFTDAPQNEIIYYGEHVESILESYFFHVYMHAIEAGKDIALLMSIAADNDEIVPLASDDDIPDVKAFIIMFFDKILGLQLSFEGCHGNT